MLDDGRFQVAQADRLQPYVGVVKVLNRWLEQQKFHGGENARGRAALARPLVIFPTANYNP
jgi:hypothetical protein